VGFFSRAKIFLDAQVDLNASALKPAAAAFGKLDRLRDFAHAEKAGVEAAGSVFRAGRHGELNVIDGEEAEHELILGDRGLYCDDETSIKTVSATVFRSKCLKLLDQATRTREPIVITKHGKAAAEACSPFSGRCNPRRLRR
jgi:hypothetical protein